MLQTTAGLLAYYLPNAAIVLFVTWIVWLLFSFFKPRNQHSLRSVAIVVLGDIGRSPRMMYHAQSFAEIEFMTDLIGYAGSKPIPALERLPKVQIRHIPELPRFLGALLPFSLFAPIKITHQIISVFFVLLVQISKPPEFILVQNPPTIPTLFIVWLVGWMRGSKIIIDWHNLGYSILELKLRRGHPFVKLATWFEGYFGKKAYAHLFVTHAMRDFLAEKWALEGRQLVLYDRPPHHFHRSSTQEVHELFLRLKHSLGLQASLHGFLPESSAPYSTPFTQIVSDSATGAPFAATKPNDLEYRARVLPINSPPIPASAPTYTEVRMPSRRPERPALLVSSTSWTPDEEFSLLLEAMELYEARAVELATLDGVAADAKERQGGKKKLPKLLVIITGKGPLREEYMEKVSQRQKTWEWVRCVSLWLEAEEYPILLGSADLGISLHSSSSALDLPMKVVDMFGCGLPVCALGFECLHELVRDNVNGRVFKTSAQLAEQIELLLSGFPNAPELDKLRASLIRTSQPTATPPHLHTAPRSSMEPEDDEWRWGTWEENWARTVRPLILSDLNR